MPTVVMSTPNSRAGVAGELHVPVATMRQATRFISILRTGPQHSRRMVDGAVHFQESDTDVRIIPDVRLTYYVMRGPRPVRFESHTYGVANMRSARQWARWLLGADPVISGPYCIRRDGTAYIRCRNLRTAYLLFPTLPEPDDTDESCAAEHTALYNSNVAYRAIWDAESTGY